MARDQFVVTRTVPDEDLQMKFTDSISGRAHMVTDRISDGQGDGDSYSEPSIM